MARKVIQGELEHAPGAELELAGPGPMYRPGGRSRCPRCGLADRPRRRVLFWLRRDLCDRCRADTEALAGMVLASVLGALFMGRYLAELARAAELERIMRGRR